MAGVRLRPTVILTTHVNFAPVARTLWTWFGIPYLAIGHGIEVWDIPRQSVRRALQEAPGLAAVSEFTRGRMTEVIGRIEDSINLLPNTFDSRHFVPGPKPRFLLKRYGLSPEQPVILTIARLASAERYKGYDQVLQALPSIRDAFPDIRYILGGQGPDRGRVERLIDEAGVSKQVTLAGYIPEHELCDHYNLCDLFAMPSKGEGFGIVFLEALACGKPVLAGNKDGSVDALLGGAIGALIDPDSVDELGQQVIAILRGAHPLAVLQDPTELRRRVCEAYDYDRFRENLRQLIQRVAQLRKGGGT